MKYSEFMNPHPSTGEIISVKMGVTLQKSPPGRRVTKIVNFMIPWEGDRIIIAVGFFSVLWQCFLGFKKLGVILTLWV